MRNNQEFNSRDAAQIADMYEWSMAFANRSFPNANLPKEVIFQSFLRKMPTNKVVGSFEHEGVKYQKVEKRDFMLNAGLEDIMSLILSFRGSSQLSEYFKEKLYITNPLFLDWVRNYSFSGDIYAMPEGTPFFSMEPQIRMHSDFDSCQIFESVILSILNRQSQIATTANDISSLCPYKTLIEGASRRATGPSDALQVSRAARIGGFTTSSLVRYGVLHNEVVRGTMGHSYVLLHQSELDAFDAQALVHGDNVVFLIDTYSTMDAIDKCLIAVKKHSLKSFYFRVDSGDLIYWCKTIYDKMKDAGYLTHHWGTYLSDDLNASRIAELEKLNVNIVGYLVGTFLVNHINPAGIVWKMTAKKQGTSWEPAAKKADDPGKSTMGGHIQVYRILDTKSGKYVKDLIGIQSQDISSYIVDTEIANPLLIPIIEKGEVVYKFPDVQTISKYRQQELSKFSDLRNYPVIKTEELKLLQQTIKFN